MSCFVFLISNTDIASYADDNTPYINDDNIDDLTTSLEKASTADGCVATFLFQKLGVQIPVFFGVTYNFFKFFFVSYFNGRNFLR